MNPVRGARCAVRGFLGCMSLVCLLSACGGPRETVVTDAENREPRTADRKPAAPVAEQSPPLIKPGLLWVQELLTFHHQAPTITADLLIRVKEPDGDAILFQISLWCPEDGRIRLKCSKLDVDFIDALVQKNGDFVLELVRSKEVVRGNLRDIHVFDQDGKVIGPPFLAYLSLLVHEAKSGPVPDRGVTKAGNGRVEAKDHITGLTVGVEVNPDDTVKSKTFFDQPDKPTVRLDYFRYKTFDQLRRPTQMQLTVPGDPSEYTVRLRELDVVPSISPDRMRFAPSQGSTEIGLEEFLKRLRD
jgi:hypothetical protein